ncbi:MAG: T9SS type A sorting domain-containing protein, partial [Tannerella sp.]|nr:T9SS type A sorting domain-containing protein [Tannerella sp.]
RGEATQTIFVGEVEMQKIVYKTGANGSYSIIQTYTDEDGTYTDEWGSIYDEHGAMINDYSEESYAGNDGYHREDVSLYERTYDAEGRPLQTVCIRNGETEYTETYESWTAVTPPPSGMGTEKIPSPLPAVKVYPNPAVDVIVIDGAPAGSTLAVFDLSGRIVYRQANISGRETVSVASWPAGLYLVTVQMPEGTVTRKTVKK